MSDWEEEWARIDRAAGEFVANIGFGNSPFEEIAKARLGAVAEMRVSGLYQGPVPSEFVVEVWQNSEVRDLGSLLGDEGDYNDYISYVERASDDIGRSYQISPIPEDKRAEFVEKVVAVAKTYTKGKYQKMVDKEIESIGNGYDD